MPGEAASRDRGTQIKIGWFLMSLVLIKIYSMTMTRKVYVTGNSLEEKKNSNEHDPIFDGWKYRLDLILN